VELQHHLKMYWSHGHKPLPSEYNILSHHGRNCLGILFFNIYTDNWILAFWVFIFQLENPLKLLIPIFTGFHCDSFLHFSLYKTMFFQKLLYYIWRYIHTLWFKSLWNSFRAEVCPFYYLGARRVTNTQTFKSGMKWTLAGFSTCALKIENR